MRRLYFRCNSGHYFHGTNCPWDGWTMDGVQAAFELFARLEPHEAAVGLEALGPLDPSPELSRRMMIIEFGDEAAAVDAICPDRYMHNGEVVLWHEIGLELS